MPHPFPRPMSAQALELGEPAAGMVCLAKALAISDSGGGLAAGQASMTSFALMECARSPCSMVILRGLALSATGIRNLNTPVS